MAEQPQVIVQPAVAPNKQYGARKDGNLKSIFAASPVYLGELTDAERKRTYQELALDGTVVGGNGINSYNRDFADAPDLTEVETGGGGLPASPYMPNLTSPGPGSVSAADQPVYNGELPDPETNVEFGSGLGGLANPADTSGRIAEQNIVTIGSYISGRSYQGSDGQN